MTQEKKSLLDHLQGLYLTFSSYVVRGIFLVVPLYFTIGLCLSVLQKIDSFLYVGIPGFGIIVLIFGSAFVGYIASKYFVNSFANFISRFLSKIPIVNVIYKASTDILGAFTGNKKNLKQPVLVTISELDGIYKLGFLTQDSLNELGLDEMVSVYILQPYSIFGDLLVVNKNKIRFLDIAPSKVTKFVISGGFSDSE